jgi:hypothetical protein
MSQIFSRCTSLVYLNIYNFTFNYENNLQNILNDINKNCNIITKKKKKNIIEEQFNQSSSV